MSQVQSIRQFVDHVRTLKGDEKGEAQVSCDKPFRAFGHAGYKEAGATLEERVRGKGLKCAPGIGPPEGRCYGTVPGLPIENNLTKTHALGSKSLRHWFRKTQRVRFP